MCADVDRRHQEKLLTVFPDLTEAQQDLLHGIFQEYYDEMEHGW